MVNEDSFEFWLSNEESAPERTDLGRVAATARVVHAFLSEAPDVFNMDEIIGDDRDTFGPTEV